MRTGSVRIGIALLVLSGGIASGASAQTSLDRAEELLELAEFEEAARTLEEVADDDSAGLDRQGVVRFYTLRAVVRSALGRDRDAGDDLAALVTVLEGREPGALPPSQRTQFDRLRRQSRDETLRVRLMIRPTEEGEVSASLTVEHDPGSVVRRTELVCRSGGREVASADSGRVTIRGETELECQGQVLGPGGWEAGRSTARWRSRETGGEIPAPLDDVTIGALAGAGAGVLLVVLIGVIAYAASSTGVSGPIWMMRE